MAKGVEDTAYYRYSRFIALNEVGGSPGRIGHVPMAFHQAQIRRQSGMRYSMTTLSTHDTKRGEDVRARLAVLSEVVDDWHALASHLMEAVPLTDAPFAYFLWQTLVGAGFIERSRLHQCIEKSMREASTSTDWLDPDTVFESAVHAAIDRVYDEPELRAPVQAFIDRITPYGWSNSLGQKLVQLTMPGVPDVYRGTEVWDDSLVDPDNRRPVDFAALDARLAELDRRDVPPPIDDTGDAKLWVTSRTLRVRRSRADLFRTYRPIEAFGSAAQHVVAFDRGGAVTVATRLPVQLENSGGWRDTEITLAHPAREIFTDSEWEGTVRLGDLLHHLPVALLVVS
jgi:(1->4)-alpha-D-glucan 1-alpha-D-glucosylmutase